MRPALLEIEEVVEPGNDTSSPAPRRPRPQGRQGVESALLRGFSDASLPVVVVLAALSVVLRVRLWMQAVVYPYDAYYYMGTAQSLAAGSGYAWRGTPHTRFLPGFPLAVAPFVKSFGPEAAAVAVSAVAWAILGVVCYLTARRLGGWLAGTAAAVWVLFHPVAVEWTSLPMAEGVFALAAYASISLMIKALVDEDPSMLIAAGAAGGYAAITRNEGVALFPIYIGCAVWLLRTRCSTDKPGHRETSIAKIAAGLVLLTVPYLLWLLWSSGKPSQQVSYAAELAANIRPGIGSLLSALFYYSWSAFRQPFVTVVGYIGIAWLLLKSPRAAVVLGSWVAAMTGIHSLWYFRYDRFALASVPALAIAGGAAVGAVGSLGAGETRRRGRFSRVYLTIGILVVIAASGAVLSREGESLAVLHMTLLDRGGGRAIVSASEIGGRLDGNLASNQGALVEFHSQKRVVDILPQYSDADLRGLDAKDIPCRKMLACFDPDRLGPGSPEQRLDALRAQGVEYLILMVDDKDPSEVIRMLGLPVEAFELRTIIVTEGPSEAGTHRATILRLEGNEPGSASTIGRY